MLPRASKTWPCQTSPSGRMCFASIPITSFASVYCVMMYTCERCGKPFLPKRKEQRFCSLTCSNKHVAVVRPKPKGKVELFAALYPAIERLYEQGKSGTDIDDLLGLPRSTSGRYLARRNKARNRKDAQILRHANPDKRVKQYMRGTDHPNYRTGRWTSRSVYRRMVVRDKCSVCGKNEGQIDAHHKNHDHFDNDPDNLMVLCASCHSRLHMQAYWLKVKSGEILRAWRPGT